MSVGGRDRRRLDAEPLTRAAFAPFGDVIGAGEEPGRIINDGRAVRFDDLAKVEVAADGGRPTIALFRTEPATLPVSVDALERHPLGSQAFVPLGGARFLVVVAPGATPIAREIRAFVTNGRQGINFHRGIWHHPLLALDRESEFVVIDRFGPGENLEWFELGDERLVVTLESGR